MRIVRARSLAGALALVVVAVPASPAAADQCPPGGGTTVVVDFADLGGGVKVGCAPSAATGFEALAQAGFEVVAVQANPAFVCRIDGRPGIDAEDCADTPPDSAFWSYWSADRGGNWRFQVSGASGDIDGDLEGWAFATGSASPPDYPVPAPATTTTTTTTSTTTTLAPPTTTTSAPTATTRPTTTATRPTSTSRLTTTTATPSTTATIPTTTATIPTTTATILTTTVTLPSATVAAAPADAEGGAGGFVAGVVVVAGIGVASWMVARRRPGGGGS